jgi:hypothetical protein
MTKISILNRSVDDGALKEFVAQASARGYACEIKNITDVDNLDETIDQLEKVVVWCSSSLETPEARNLLLESLKANKKLILHAGLEATPGLEQPYFQGRLANTEKKINLLPAEVAIAENSTVYRLVVMGGQAMQIFKNTGSEYAPLDPVSDASVIKKLSKLGELLASKFNLFFSVSDFLIDGSAKKTYLVGLNSAPFGATVELGKEPALKLGAKLFDKVSDLIERDSLDALALVKRLYDAEAETLGTSGQHYWSRMYLWTQEDAYKEKLNTIKDAYSLDEELEEQGAEEKAPRKHADDSNHRDFYHAKYPALRDFSKQFFKILFSQTLFNTTGQVTDIRPEQITAAIELADTVIQDVEAMLVLSTSVINFMYSLENLCELANQSFKVDVDQLNSIFELGYTRKHSNKQLVYYVTHSIIGASRFYSRSVTDHQETYLKMLLKVEELIENDFFDITLDNKLEFLVCCRLLGYTSRLTTIIAGEAAASLSPLGNFIADKADNHFKLGIRTSEHRNTLYLMAFSQPAKFN